MTEVDQYHIRLQRWLESTATTADMLKAELDGILERQAGQDDPPADEPPPAEPPITDAQARWIEDAVAHLGIDQRKLGAWLQNRYGVETYRALTSEQAHQLIKAIQRGALDRDRPVLDPPPPQDDPPRGGDDPPVDPPANPPQGWSPPNIGYVLLDAPQAIDQTVEAKAVKTTNCAWKTTLVTATDTTGRIWLDLFDDQHQGATFVGAEGATFTKLRADANGWGQIGHVYLWDLTFENEPNSTFTVGAADQQPKDLEPGEDWTNSPRATKPLGLTAFHRCHFGKQPGNTTWQGFGMKMHLHQQAPHDLLVDRCSFTESREHHIYSEWVQRLHVTGCDFPPTGGNAIQVGSRGGHLVEPNYLHGNRLNIPAGLDGWALIEDCTFMEALHKFRDASDITFAGFLGPIVIRRCQFRNTISAIAITSDPFKGAWVANGDDIPWNQPSLWRSEVEGKNYTQGLYTHREVWIDDIEVEWDPAGGRAMVMLSGIKDVHIGRFQIGGNMAAIEINNEYGGPWKCGTVRFYDPASVEAHLGRIGYHNKQAGRFQAYTEEQLQDMTVLP